MEGIEKACIDEGKNQLSKNLVGVKFGVSKSWVLVKCWPNGVSKQLLKQFCITDNVNINDIAFSFYSAIVLS